MGFAACDVVEHRFSKNSLGESVHLPTTDISDVSTLDPAASAATPVDAVLSSPVDRMVQVLGGLLPSGSTVAVAWRDWALGNGGAVTPGSGQVLRKRA